MARDELRIGIDLGGSKIEIIALDRAGRERVRRRVQTPRGDYPATLDTIARMVHEVEAALGVQGTVGVGMPGALSSATGRVKNANSTCLIGHPLGADMESRLGRPVRLANDADCFALSEAVDGAAAGARSVFGVILGTGVGGGIVIDGRPLAGPNAIAGEWGHNPIPRPDRADLPLPQCYCGRSGCVETYLSGPGMMRDHHAATGETIAPETIAARAEAGDAACEATLVRYGDRLGRALAVVINILDPHVIVLGGGLSNIQRLVHDLPRRLRPHVFSDTIETRIVANRHGDSSGVRGAAWLWDDRALARAGP